jgi:hypothetical protein
LVYLSNSSGRNDDNVTFVFDEVGANNKKIAVTTSDEITQCYVELEKWDATNKKAWLWVKVPSISNTVDTDLYLYYDNNQADNTNYVGESNSTPAENVWNSTLVFVSHMQDDPDTSHIRDSTQNDNDGTKRAANEPTEENGKTGKAQNFDGGDDYITRSATSSLNLQTAWTLSAWLYLETSPAYYYIVTRNTATYSDAQYGYYLRSPETGGLWGALHNGELIDVVSRTWPMQTWVYTTITWDGNYLRAYYNGAQDGDPMNCTGTATNQGDWFNIGRRSNSADGTSSAGLFGGRIDEVRVSNMTRSPAWIKASYESERDDLLDFGAGASDDTSECTYDYVLRVNNTVTNSWQVRLKKYADSNVNRLEDCTIYFHNSTDGTSNQIIIETGSYINQTGTWYNLGDSETIYIAMTVQANSAGISHVHAYLEIRTPNTTTYAQYIITFEIT